jgi:nicotinamide-nucleotide amidase
MEISVLGIGTELTVGQILNRNGQWISQRMRNLGVSTSMQLVVPDEEKLILEALEFCLQHSDILFVTGGLGPTTDDFTRDIISRWSGRELEWDESSWEHISERLTSRGMAVKEIQRQQCYFPKGSQILKNRVGTANAFSMSYQGKEVFALPGPPKEIETIWQDHIDPLMKERTAGVDPLITKSWDTIGLGESDIADRAEAALKGCSFEKAYRVHLPYVEFKITYLKSQDQEARKWIQAVDDALGSLTVLRDGEDAARELSEILSRREQSLWVCDEIPGSFLIQRLFPFSKGLLREKKFNFISTYPTSFRDSKSIFCYLREEGNGFARAEITVAGQTRSQIFQSPYRTLNMREREQQYFAEMALVFWMKELATN